MEISPPLKRGCLIGAVSLLPFMLKDIISDNSLTIQKEDKNPLGSWPYQTPPKPISMETLKSNSTSSCGYMGLMSISLCGLVLLTFFGLAASQNIVTNLPGFEGDLPFKLETGYVGVGESNEIQLFYYFVESQRSPTDDPLMLWQSGGPGCTSQTGLFYENGPLAFKLADYNGSLPSLHLNPYAWTQRLNILYVDVPAGSGFSYSTTQEGYYVDELKSAAHSAQFIRKWLIDHPQYLTNALYIAGDSFTGMVLPIIVQNIHKYNEAGLEPYLNLRGYLLGNPVTDYTIDGNAVIPFAHRMTLISDELYKSAEESCNGDFVNVNQKNTKCVADIAAIDELLLNIYTKQILEPICQPASPRPGGNQKRSLQQYYENILPSQPSSHSSWCRDLDYKMMEIWANDKSVRKVLNVREGTTGVFVRCNRSKANEYNVPSTVEYHRNLSNTILRALVYSGDHDMTIPHIGTQNWIRSLNLNASEIWRAWYVDGQVAGYTEKFTNQNFNLVFATVKGGGHDAPTYKRKECYAMIDRWFADRPL